LPGSGREARAVAALYPSGSTTLLTGPRASEERVLAAAADAEVIHLATHGSIEDGSPLDSLLVLSSPEGNGPGRNGLLQAWEILEHLETSARLVVLSACQTADDASLGGEGLLGLAHAFQSAGAREVLATAWRIDDRAASELMIDFHRHLRRGQSSAEALHASTRRFLADHRGERWGSPYFWGAFKLFTGGRSSAAERLTRRPQRPEKSE
ncbi:MAG: CHAT domain-containing protein, partial [Acidobacteriota bacterium]